MLNKINEHYTFLLILYFLNTICLMLILLIIKIQIYVCKNINAFGL